MQNSPAAERKPHRGDLNLLVLPGEQVRKPYSWPLTNACPHCGSIGWFDKNELAGVGHCALCGTWVYKDEPIPWQRESNARLVHRPPKRREITATCQQCGKGFPTNNHNGMVKWCPECREDVRRQKENARLRAKREEKKRATTPSLGDSISGKNIINKVRERGYYESYQRKERRLKLGLSSGGAGGDVENIAQERRP